MCQRGRWGALPALVQAARSAKKEREPLAARGQLGGQSNGDSVSQRLKVVDEVGAAADE